jgi:acetyl-CoA C-acetyltransferase
MAEAYIVAAARTAGGRKGGRLAGWHPADLAASVLNSLVERSGAAPDQIEDVIMGCVMQAGEQSNNVARNAIMASKLPESVPGTSVDRQCGSSQQALHFAAQAVMSGTMDIVIAAGVEPPRPDSATTRARASRSIIRTSCSASSPARK